MIDEKFEELVEPKPEEWSKEDEMYLSQAIETLERENYLILADKLKSLRSKPHWKPSEEQMRALGDYIDGEEISEYDMEEIVRLYHDLLKLK